MTWTITPTRNIETQAAIHPRALTHSRRGATLPPIFPYLLAHQHISTSLRRKGKQRGHGRAVLIFTRGFIQLDSSSLPPQAVAVRTEGTGAHKTLGHLLFPKTNDGLHTGTQCDDKMSNGVTAGNPQFHPRFHPFGLEFTAAAGRRRPHRGHQTT